MPSTPLRLAALPLVLAAACGEVQMSDDVGPDAATVADATGGPDACVPRTCAEVGAECGTIDDGCGQVVACPACRAAEVCGVLADRQCDPAPAAALRSGFVQSDGAKSYSQTCDLAADGTLDCTIATHPVSAFGLPPGGLTLPAGVGIADRTVYLYRAGTTTRLYTAFLQSDGLAEWAQTCDAPASGPLACDPATHPYQRTALPPPGLSLAAGTHVAGRYGYLYYRDGVLRIRNGYVQSDGLASYAQDCAVSATGDLACEPSFTTETLPPAGATPARGTTIGDRYTYTYVVEGRLRLRSGYVQSDGAYAWSQTCDISPAGEHDCAVATHPFTGFTMPPSGVTPDMGTALTHRYTFTLRP